MIMPKGNIVWWCRYGPGIPASKNHQLAGSTSEFETRLVDRTSHKTEAREDHKTKEVVKEIAPSRFHHGFFVHIPIRKKEE
jgi:hypothetical protein